MQGVNDGRALLKLIRQREVKNRKVLVKSCHSNGLALRLIEMCARVIPRYIFGKNECLKTPNATQSAAADNPTQSP